MDEQPGPDQPLQTFQWDGRERLYLLSKRDANDNGHHGSGASYPLLHLIPRPDKAFGYFGLTLTLKIPVSMRPLLQILLFSLAILLSDNASSQTRIKGSYPEGLRVLGNHSWTEIVTDSTVSEKLPVSIQGKADGSGLTAISVILTNRTIEGYLTGNKAYVTCAQKNWKSEPLLAKGESPGALMTRLIRGVIPPAPEINFFLKNGEKFRKDGDVISGELPDSAAKKLLEYSEVSSRRVELSERKAVRKEATSARANVTLWTKDNAVTKYEIRLTGKIDVDGKETDVVRTRTIEIKDVGTTKIELPEKARQKLGL